MKLTGLVIGGVLMTLITALMGTLFMLIGWNYGVVPALSIAHPVSLGEAFCLAMFLAGLGGMFKSTLTVNTKDS